jgi:hypothetical protein
VRGSTFFVRVGRGARRLRGLVVLAVIAMATVTAVAIWKVDRQPVADDSIGDVVRVGVPEGGSIPEYEQRTRTALAALSGRDVYALVTLRAYVAPERLAPVLGAAPLTEVYARVPLPHLQSEIVRMPAYRVPDDVTGGMAEVARRKDREAADYARLAANVVGSDAKDRELRSVYLSGQQIAAAEAAAYREQCSCVYAAVVLASPAVLRQVAQGDEVRTVEPAPQVRSLDRTVFLPPLPEQRDKAGPPDDSAEPTASPATPPH